MKLKASVTVETALIMPVVLLVIFFLISMSFYEHDKAVFTEQSFIGAREKAMFDEQGIIPAAKAKRMCMSTKNISYGIEDNRTTTNVLIKGRTKVYLLGRGLEVKRQGNYVKCYAPEMIRLVNFGISIKDMIFDGE